MATSPVRIRDEDRRKLERLRRAVEDATGKKPTQQDVLGLAIDHAARHKDAFVAEVAWRPWSEEDLERFLAKVRESEGWETGDIDEIVYGDGA